MNDFLVKLAKLTLAFFLSITYYIEHGRLFSKEVGKLKYLLRFENSRVLRNFDLIHPPFPSTIRTLETCKLSEIQPTIAEIT